MRSNDAALRKLIDATVADDHVECSRLLRKQPELVIVCAREGARRQSAKNYFLPDISGTIAAAIDSADT